MFGGVAVLIGEDRGIRLARPTFLDDPAGNDPVRISALAGHRLVEASAFVLPGFAALAVMGGLASRGVLRRG